MDERPAGDAELERLKRALLSFLVDGLARGELEGSRATLSEPVLGAIRIAADDAMKAAAAEQLARLSGRADTLKSELTATGGYDSHALARVLAEELRPPPEPRRPNWALIGIALMIGLAVVTIALQGLAWWRADNGAARQAQAERSARVLEAKVHLLCSGFAKIQLPAAPATPPPPRPAGTGGAQSAAVTKTVDAALLDLARGDLSALCIR